MKKITAGDPESRSVDPIAENLAQLKELFPEAFVEGRVDFAVLRQLLGDAVEEREERYGLNWHGKRRARQFALTPSTGTLRPAPEDSVDWDTTQNLMIEGDNLEVLKLLQKSYAGKVKLIYIDPPYNTGKDFVYPDNYQDNLRNYLELTGQVGEGGRLSTNAETSGRFHTQWLNMMYPRLKLARELLREDGVIFISIDDGEQHHLRIICDEIFGQENHAGSIAWKKRSSPDARDTIGAVHDTIHCYVKDATLIKNAITKIPLSKSRIESYSNPDDDPRGPWASVDMTGMTGRATKDQYFRVTLPSGRIIGPPEGRSWGLAEKTYHELLADNRLWFGKTGDSVPRIKKFLGEADGQAIPSLWEPVDVGSNEEAKKEVNELLQEVDVFDTPKPIRLISRMINCTTNKDRDEIVLDFFAGSGSTGHACWTQNILESSRLRFILVQLPEPTGNITNQQRKAFEFCDKLGKPRNIAELTKERLRRAAQKIKAENPLFSGDLGFRVFKLATSNIKEWAPDRENLSQTLEEAVDHLKADRTEDDILFEMLLKLGLDLAEKIESRRIAGKTVYSVGAGTLFACLAPGISRTEAEPLAQGIADWRDELDAAVESTVYFRDAAFSDDVTKANLSEILKQRKLTRVLSL